MVRFSAVKGSPIARAFKIIGNNIIAEAGYSGIYLSTDNGLTWAQINNGIAKTEVIDLASKGNNIFASTYNGGFRSTNNGLSWAQLPFGSLPGYITDISFSGKKIYAITQRDGLYLSTNDGIDWSNIGLSGKGISSLTVKENTIIAGAWVGVYLSTDNGINWTYVTNGWPHDPYDPSYQITRLALYKDNLLPALMVRLSFVQPITEQIGNSLAMASILIVQPHQIERQ